MFLKKNGENENASETKTKKTRNEFRNFKSKKKWEILSVAGIEKFILTQILIQGFF